jgi:hypothetical protein
MHHTLRSTLIYQDTEEGLENAAALVVVALGL